MLYQLSYVGTGSHRSAEGSIWAGETRSLACPALEASRGTLCYFTIVKVSCCAFEAPAVLAARMMSV